MVARLGLTAALDDALGSIKQRDRGLSTGQFLVALAQAQMLGAQFWTGLDHRRGDAAGEAISAVPTPASTTAVDLAQRFGPAQLAGVEEGIGEIVGRVMGCCRLPGGRCCAPVGPPSTWTAATWSATGRRRKGSPTATREPGLGGRTRPPGPRPGW